MRGQQATRANPVEQELLRLERLWLDAYEQRDVTAMERILSDDYIITYNGQMSDKARTIEGLRRPVPAERALRFRSDDVRVRVYGDAAVLTGRVIDLRRRPDGGDEVVGQARYTDTYVRRQGRWQVVSSQVNTLLPERLAATVDPRVYDSYTGRYELAPGRVLAIAREGTTLRVQPPGQQQPFEILPESETQFFARGADIQIYFVRDGAGRATHVVLQQGSQNLRVARRVE